MYSVSNGVGGGGVVVYWFNSVRLCVCPEYAVCT